MGEGPQAFGDSGPRVVLGRYVPIGAPHALAAPDRVALQHGGGIDDPEAAGGLEVDIGAPTGAWVRRRVWRVIAQDRELTGRARGILALDSSGFLHAPTGADAAHRVLLLVGVPNLEAVVTDGRGQVVAAPELSAEVVGDIEAVAHRPETQVVQILGAALVAPFLIEDVADDAGAHHVFHGHVLARVERDALVVAVMDAV